jgi:hypothetical protein
MIGVPFCDPETLGRCFGSGWGEITNRYDVNVVQPRKSRKVLT